MEQDIFDRKAISHKGSYGKVGIIGGSIGMCGSITLSSKAALRLGCGYVYTIIPNSLLTIMSIKLCESIIVAINDDNKGYFIKASAPEIIEKTQAFDAIAVGMGMQTSDDIVSIIKALISEVKIPILIDADGINAISKDPQILLNHKAKIILTPHPGELARLLNVSIKEIQKRRLYYCEYTANKFQVTVVLKGHQTVVSTVNKKSYINKTGNAGMATAGSGDVLSGMITALLAQGFASFEAAKLGVYLHGLAGDVAAKELNQVSLIARDLITHLPKALNVYKKENKDI